MLALYPARLPKYTTTQLTALVVLRVLIGWHFLYEGMVKVVNPYWTSAGFFLETKGIFSGLATAIVASPAALGIVDFLNKWGLIAIGLGLIAGCLTRIASISGIALLFFYYIFNPPFIGYTYTIPVEGSYLVVNKNLIEMCALFVLTIFPTGTIIGLDRLIFLKKKPE
ncbi:MAG: DoxX subfamily [Candidatus Aminicenantes bacterium]|nr:DoxX subfamily [Candidatus Aminicenantes bacterium]